MRNIQPILQVGAWVAVLGVVGFVAGFFGPIILRPDANQGPLVGIFITGPGGAAAGLLLGLLFRVLPVSEARRWQALAASAAALGLGTLYFCLPPPETVGRLVQGTVADCREPAELTGEAVRKWEKRAADASWAKVRAGWQDEVPAMLRASPGVVLTLEVSGEKPILRHRKPWNSGRVTAGDWQQPGTGSQRYFADFQGARCRDYAAELPLLWVHHGQGSDSWPPDDLPNLLGVARVEEVPPRYRDLQ